MFKSLIKVFGLIFGAFSNASDSQQESASPDEQDDQDHTSSSSNPEEDSLLIDDLEVSEVDPLGDWGAEIPQRVSSLFPQTLPTTTTSTKASSKPSTQETALPDIKREVPSPEQFFQEAEAELQPKVALPPPERPLPQPVATIDDSDIIHPQAGQLYNAQIQIGRVVKKEEPEPLARPDIDFSARIPEVRAGKGNKRRRLIQPLTEGQRGQRQQDIKDVGSVGGWGVHGQVLPPSAAHRAAYHDVAGERGATSRAQFDHDQSHRGHVPAYHDAPEFPLALPIGSKHVQFSGPSSAPPLKPKPVRFKRGNYLRFWGNYSAQPHYLHFGSLIRSERFIQLLPTWHHELDDLEEEAKEEWAYLDEGIPHEGEADWRRLLNPTMSSPIEFLIHRDRVEQIAILPRGRSH